MRVPEGAVSTCDRRAALVNAGECAWMRARPARLIEQPWPQPCGQRIKLAAVEELMAALEARLFRAGEACSLQVGS